MKTKYIAGIVLFLVIVAAIGLLAGHGGGDISNVCREIGDSETYNAGEIGKSMDVVERYFDREFEGCTLTLLTYDEAFSNKYAAEWAENYNADEAIVLTSSFEVDETGGDGSLNPNYTYQRWQWVLTRNNGGSWKLQTWGYG